VIDGAQAWPASTALLAAGPRAKEKPRALVLSILEPAVRQWTPYICKVRRQAKSSVCPVLLR
jgi:hypothetical protein